MVVELKMFHKEFKDIVSSFSYSASYKVTIKETVKGEIFGIFEMFTLSELDDFHIAII